MSEYTFENLLAGIKSSLINQAELLASFGYPHEWSVMERLNDNGSVTLSILWSDGVETNQVTVFPPG